MPPEKIELDRGFIGSKAFHALSLGEKETARKLIRRKIEVVPGGVNASAEPQRR